MRYLYIVECGDVKEITPQSLAEARASNPNAEGGDWVAVVADCPEDALAAARLFDDSEIGVTNVVYDGETIAAIDAPSFDAIADELLRDCPDEALADHKRVANKVRQGEPWRNIVMMPELDRWPELHSWLRHKLTNR